MRLFKSDGRYNYNNLGYIYIAHFNWSSDSKLYASVCKSLEELYGPKSEQVLHEKGHTYWRWNENYRLERNYKQKRCRIYLREEEVLTMALLNVKNESN